MLIKARSLMVHSDPDSQREDLLALLTLIDDPRQMGQQLSRGERRLLRTTEERLNLPGLSLLNADKMRRAELAYRLLIRDPDAYSGQSSPSLSGNADGDV